MTFVEFVKGADGAVGNAPNVTPVALRSVFMVVLAIPTSSGDVA